MKLVRGAAVVMVGGALALGVSPAYAGGHGHGHGHGDGGTVVKATTPKTCAPATSPTGAAVTRCTEGWSVTRTVKKHRAKHVKVRSQVTTTATAPGINFKDVTDTRDHQVYKRGDLVYQYKVVTVNYFPAAAPPCVRTITTVVDHGTTTTDEDTNCTFGPPA